MSVMESAYLIPILLIFIKFNFHLLNIFKITIVHKIGEFHKPFKTFVSALAFDSSLHKAAAYVVNSTCI